MVLSGNLHVYTFLIEEFVMVLRSWSDCVRVRGGSAHVGLLLVCALLVVIALFVTYPLFANYSGYQYADGSLKVVTPEQQARSTYRSFSEL